MDSSRFPFSPVRFACSPFRLHGWTDCTLNTQSQAGSHPWHRLLWNTLWTRAPHSLGAPARYSFLSPCKTHSQGLLLPKHSPQTCISLHKAHISFYPETENVWWMHAVKISSLIISILKSTSFSGCSPIRWLEHKLAHVFSHKQSDQERQERLDYLDSALKKAKSFHDTLVRSPCTNRPFVVVTSEAWPTPTRLKSSLRKRPVFPFTQELRISQVCQFEPGDGIVSKAAAMMPIGFQQYTVLETKFSHLTMLNDLKTMERALRKICTHF